MTDKKITALIDLGAAPASTDVLPIVDVSATTTKKVTVADLFTDPNVTGTATFSGDLAVDTDTLFVDVSTGNVGIGTISPAAALHAQSNTAQSGRSLRLAYDGTYYFEVEQLGSGGVSYNAVSASVGGHRFELDGSEKARIDYSGNLLVGTTAYQGSGGSGAKGFYAGADGLLSSARSNATVAVLNRTTSDGVITEFRKDGTTVGTIGTGGGDLNIGTGDTRIRFNDATDNLIPLNESNGYRDNAITIGDPSARFQDIYATNGTIQTSDRNEKQDIEELSEAEQRVAVAAKDLLRKFRWKSVVEEKGDAARIHFGIIAQDLQAAFEAEGLDAGRYGMFINSTWVDEETGEERSRMGVRYSELLAFIIAAI